MNWYKEDIGKAIVESKTKKLIFMVYVFDSSSTETTELWNKERIYSICNENCVSLSLEAESQICNQFKQIYSVTVYPTTYFIGNNGRPLDVVSGNLTEDELYNKLVKVVEAHNLSKETPTTSSAQSSSSAKPEENADAGAASSGESQKSLDERVALAKEKLRVIQEKKRAEEEEKERNSEMERRKMGQEIIKAKKEREEQELKKIADEKRREKLEDEMAKQRIKERIQQDREEKQKKYDKEKQELEKTKQAEKAKQELLEQQKRQSEAARNSQIARIQFRFVDGSSLNNQFDPIQKLEEVKEFVVQKLRERNESLAFTMHSSFPKREYTSSDMSLTLAELELAPTATILIIPTRSQVSKKIGNLMPNLGTSSSSSSGSSSTSSSLVTYGSDILSFIFLPITIIWGVVSSFFGLNTNQNNRGNSGANASTQRGNTNSDNENLRRRNNDRFRSLNDNRRDDDENATWNGNSTQQM